MGESFVVYAGVVNILGSEFFVDGEELDVLLPGEPFTITNREVTLSGLLADGEPFSFQLNTELDDGSPLPGDFFDPDATLTVTLTSVPPITGDFDADGEVDGGDADFYIGNLNQPATGELLQLDLNGDGNVTIADHNLLVTTLVVTSNGVIGALLGDVNLDGRVNVLSDGFALVRKLGGSATSRSQGALNADGVVNVLGDRFILIGQLGQTNDP